MPKATTSLPDLSAWEILSLRLTAFHAAVPQTTDNNWWEEATKSVPESKTMKPREGGYEISGPYGGGALTLKADHVRFDWLLQPLISPDKLIAGLPTAGLLPDTLKTFTLLVQEWLPKAPNINRIAFGADVVQKVADRVTGYNLISKYLPAVTLDPEGSTEFSYSINRPRTLSEMNGIKINRLSKWSVAYFQSLTLSLVMGQPSVQRPSGDAIHALRLEIDTNTDELRSDPFPNSMLPELFGILTKFSEEILREGDIP